MVTVQVLACVSSQESRRVRVLGAKCGMERELSLEPDRQAIGRINFRLCGNGFSALLADT